MRSRSCLACPSTMPFVLALVAFSTKVGHEPVAERQRVAMLQAASAAAREVATVAAWAAVASAGRWRG